MSRALMELHWLPVDKRIEYKLLLYTYRSIAYTWHQGICVNWYVPYEPRKSSKVCRIKLTNVFHQGNLVNMDPEVLYRAICESMDSSLRGEQGCLA